MSKFTEGDWKAFHRPEAYGQPDIYEVHWSEDQECVAEIVHGEANANLMAASKDMYDDLEDAVASMSATLTEYRNVMSKPFINGIEQDIKIFSETLARARGEI